MKKDTKKHSKETKSHRILSLLRELKAGESFVIKSTQTLALTRYCAFKHNIKISRRKLVRGGWRIFKND